ncbi:MYND-type domain-containing protein [Favolaschia claudopus]|uniref:MYND-type domain-containing protein n=1 Tax=Favolaschia claudopus TaxID=2862362 RepID=A0AAW0E723_9AGAR
MKQKAIQGPPSESGVHQPRAHLDGINLPKDFPVPTLKQVREDAVEAKQMQQHPEEYEDIVFMFPPGSPANQETLPKHLKLGLVFNNLLPGLFKFSYFVAEGDVPEDVVSDCIWALSLFIRVMEECSENVLRAAGHVKKNNDFKMSRYITLINARAKIVSHLIKSKRVEEAVPYAKAIVDEEYSRGADAWLENPMPFMVYGETLLLSRLDDHEAVKMLRRAMLGVESDKWPADSRGVSSQVKGRALLARALRNVGADEEAGPHEKFLVNWFRKHPRTMDETSMRRLLLPEGPVLRELGGETWLDNRKQTSKTEQRLTKLCRTCGAREPLVTLMRCNNCKYTYYCSRECQRANWKLHNERAQILDKIERMSLTDPDGAKRAADWSQWCNANHDANQFGLVHALGLHQDPERGRTHIVIKYVEYVPTATKLKHKFSVVSCGVFLIKDVLRDIEVAMNLDPGEGEEYIDSVVREVRERPGEDGRKRIQFIDFSLGDGISPWLGGGATTIEAIRAHPYNPDWRKLFNVGAPPSPMKLVSGAKDVEHVF